MGKESGLSDDYNLGQWIIEECPHVGNCDARKESPSLKNDLPNECHIFWHRAHPETRPGRITVTREGIQSLLEDSAHDGCPGLELERRRALAREQTRETLDPSSGKSKRPRSGGKNPRQKKKEAKKGGNKDQ